MERSIIAFIDVLATKESVSVSNQAFEFLITEFHRELCSNAIKLNESDNIRLFSDCAFIEFKGNIEIVISYLSTIREILFNKQIYFKCAISEGELKNDEFDPFSAITKEENKKKLNKIVNYQYFGADSVSIYAMHEKFKGIGFYVDNKLAEKHIDDNYFVKSGFYADATIKSYIEFWDIGFKPSLMASLHEDDSNSDYLACDEKFIDLLLKSLLYSKAKKKEYARYYIPTLISIVRSSDFSKMYFDNTKKSWIRYPVIFKRLFLDGFYIKQNRSIPGLDSVFFCMINEIFLLKKSSRLSSGDNNIKERSQENEELRDEMIEKITSYIAKRNGLINKVRSIPPELLDPCNVQIILEKYAVLGIKTINA